MNRSPRPFQRAFLAGLGVLAAAVGALALPDPALPVRIAPLTPQITLAGPYATARVLLDGAFPDGARRDVTGDALFASLDPKVATIDDEGVVRARGGGVTTVVASVLGRTTRIPVRVLPGAAPTFVADVVPILTRAGCSSGACHGANAGRGGFHLSLLGYDPDGDWLALTRFVGGRRIQRSQPDASLILRKAVGDLKHGGGMRFAADSVEYRTLRDWIAAGAPGPAAEAAIVALEVTPARRTLSVGQSQRYRVVARTADGKRRDVTARTLFSSGDGAILDVDRSGRARVVGPGEGAVVVRYGGVFTVARITAPFGPARPPAPSTNPIDRLVHAKVAALGLEVSPRCTDDEFLRRASLDITGLLPTPEAARAFLADRRDDKRARLVDSLLASPEYVDYWTLKWADLLRVAKKSLFPKGVDTYYAWIRQSVAENKPWDRFARELLTATGSAYQVGPANFVRAGTEVYQPTADPRDLGEATAQTLLGVRLQCARCHNHPFEKWTQTQFFQLAAFFARVESRPGAEPNEQVVATNTHGEIYHPRGTGRVAPAALDAPALDPNAPGDRRAALADWTTSPQNPFFAKLIANRLWKHYLGRGLVEPVDDFRVTNPSTNDPLLDHLAAEVRAGGYDLKRLMRQILLSETYQRSSRRLPGNAADTRYHSRFLPRRMGAEQLLEAVCDVTGTRESFEGYPPGTRATQLKDTSVASSFLDAFGRPPRHTTCECERSNEPSVAQALLLMNNPQVQSRLGAAGGRVASLVERKAPPEEVVETLYLSALTRFPTPAEKARAVAWLGGGRDPKAAAEDLLWALLNAKEFVFTR